MFKKYFSKSSDSIDVSQLTVQEEEILEKNLVWIFADRRSGTTWLGMELLSHNTKYIDEPLIGLHLGYYEPSKDGYQLTSEIHQNRADYFFSDKYENVWKTYLRKLILNRIHEQIQDLSSIIVIKEPTGSLAAPMIAKCLPRSKIIIILRDGRDVLDSKIDSLQKGGWATTTGHPEVTKQRRMTFIKTRGKIWVKLIEIILKTKDGHPKDLCFLTKYEDLRKNTIEVLTKIYDFIGIKISNDELQKVVDKYSFEKIPSDQKGEGKFRRFATPELWKKNFDDEEKQVLERIMGKTLKKIGYS